MREAAARDRDFQALAPTGHKWARKQIVMTAPPWAVAMRTQAGDLV
jgi:hypothetical protein